MLETGEVIRLQLNDISDLKDIAKSVLEFCGDSSIVCFKGEMGAGKTTLIRELCQQIGVEDNVNSPSFGLVNEYMTNSGETIYHFDFYRIEKLEEALKIGVEEYFDSGDLCLIEWPEHIEPLIPPNYIQVELNLLDDQKREVYLKKYE